MIMKGDFVELDYTARLKDEQLVFDTTSMEVAKAAGNFNPKFNYKPVIICVGEGQIIRGLDSNIEGKEVGAYNIVIKPEDGFGKKRADLLKLLPLSLFKRDKVEPFPGLDVNVDGQVGVVKSVSGGRVIVDFNHPLSGKDLSYDVEIKRVVLDAAEKLSSVLNLTHLPYSKVEVALSSASVAIKEALPAEVEKALASDLCRMTGLSEVKFVVEEAVESIKPESLAVEDLIDSQAAEPKDVDSHNSGLNADEPAEHSKKFRSGHDTNKE